MALVKTKKVNSDTVKKVSTAPTTMRGLFFIVKGQYKKGVAPSFNNRVSNDTSWIGGYDPSGDDTEEWYMLLDCKTFHCVACGGDYDKVLRGVYTTIKKHKGLAKKYFKHVSDTTSDDFYEVHYLGHRPLDGGERAKKAVGRCPRVSPVMQELYKHIYDEFGDYYSEDIKRLEDLAYEDLVEEKPINKTRKLVSKNKLKVSVVNKETHKEEVSETPTPKKVTTKVKMGVKKLSMG